MESYVGRKFTKLLPTLLVVLLWIPVYHAQQINTSKPKQLVVFSQGSKRAEEAARRHQQASGTITWLKPIRSSNNRLFIENKGQCDAPDNVSEKDILYTYRDGITDIFFTKKGLIYRVSGKKQASEEEWNSFAKTQVILEESGDAEEEIAGKRFIPTREDVIMQWQGANPEPEILASEEAGNYFNYLMLSKKAEIIGHAKGFKKLVYKNLYPHIDLEYSIHPDRGIKYAFILHPGADASVIRMKYPDKTVRLDADKNIVIQTAQGNLIDHAPSSYFQSPELPTPSHFVLLTPNLVGFDLSLIKGEIKNVLVIDPWTVGPPIAVNEAADDIAVDGAGNTLVYSIDTTTGGRSHVTKFNAAGVQQWTLDLITKFGYNQIYQGDVKADPAGNVYLTIGLGNFPNYYNTVKVDPTGTTRLWGSAAPGSGTTDIYETWNLSFNCDNTQLIQSGGGTYNGVSRYHNLGDWESVNTSTGAETSFHVNDTLGDIISSFWAPNGMIYHLSSDSNYKAQQNPVTVPKYTSGPNDKLVCVNPATGLRIFTIPTGYSFRDFDKKAPNSAGMNSLTGSCAYIYTTDGLNLDQWDAANGAHIHTTTITGGKNVASNGSSTNFQINGGLLVDKCGNVFVGSNTNIYEYDQNLNLIATISGLPDMVFDLALGTNGTLYACGGATDATSFVSAITVSVCTPPSALTASVTQPLCAGNTGSITANPTFCGAPYSYSWNTGQTTQTISGLGAGSYTVIVKGSLLCPSDAGDTVIVTINAPPAALSSGISPVNISCNGLCNGTATVTPSGGTAPYTYAWTNGGGTAVTASSLCPNTYVCTITDHNGCTTTKSATITQPGTLSVAPAQTNVNCFGNTTGTATVTASGGTSAYTYSWTGSPPIGQGTNSVSGLSAGTYTCTTNDSKGCVVNHVFTISQPASALSTAPSQTNLSCNGVCNGTATASSSGGTAPYTYSWTGNPGTTSVISSLCSGNYTCTVTDSKGCTFTSAPYTITQPALLTLSVSGTTQSACSGSTGTASVTTGGGNPAYTYVWTPAPGSGQGTATAGGLAPGTYSVTVHDANGCSQTTTANITTAGGPTASLTSSASPSCNGACTGTAQVNGSGGTGTLTYSWSPTGGSSATAGSLCAGSYVCHITDQNGCTTTQNVTLAPAPAITATPSSTNASCGMSNGSATGIASGGTGTLTYSWNPAPGTGQGTTLAGGLSAGTYTLFVSDQNSCVQQFTIAVNNSGGPSATAVHNNLVCNGVCNGTMSVTASGGISPYTYSWSNDPLNTTNSASSLCAGTYTCYVYDHNNCLITQIDTLIQPAPLAAVPIQNNVTCNAACNGKAIAMATGGSAPYTYSWAGSPVTVDSLTGLCPNTYSCTITDANGCTVLKTFVLTQPGALSALSNNTNVSCNGNSNATAQVTVSGGTVGSGYSYSWNPAPASGQGTGSVGGLSQGSWTCTITDSSSCSLVQTFNITQPPVLTSAGTPSNATCQKNNGAASIAASGGTAAYSYSWNPAPGTGQNTASAGNLSPGIYTCTVTDANGCSTLSTVTILNNGIAPVSVIANSGPLNFCNGGSVILSASGGSSYSWSTGSIADSITVTAAGIYTLYSTNACGTDSSKVTVTLIAQPSVTITGLNTLCAGDSAKLMAQATGSPPYTYSWNPGGSSTNSIYASNSGTYSVTVSNQCGSTTSTYSVTVYTVMAHFTPNVVTGTAPLAVNFMDSSSVGVTSWAWAFGEGSTGTGQNPTHTYTAAGTYTVTETVTDPNGCTSVYTRVIVVTDVKSWVIIPNVFTPNGDGSNDVFQINSRGISTFNCKIYDRWGVMMAELYAPSQGWDGYTLAGLKAVNGTYYYILKAQGDDGVSYDLTGFLMLMRD